jgi:hypothetical protein
MKKLFAISLILVIAASAAFAEVTVGGTAGYGVTVIKGDNSDGSVPGVTKAGPTGRIDAVYANDEGSFGALVRVDSNAKPASRIFAWWQPLSQLKLTLGGDGNGQFGREKIEGWSWTGAAGDEGVGYTTYQYTHNVWSAPGFSKFGATLALTPIDGLAINVMIPYEKADEKAAEVYNQMTGQLTYNFADVGELGVTYKSGAGYRDWGTLGTIDIGVYSDLFNQSFPVTTGTNDPGAVYAHFYLTAIQSLKLNIGLKYTFGGTIESAPSTKLTLTPPINAGFGLDYNISDTIGVKAVLLARVAGSVKIGDVTTDIPLNLGFDVMPYFDLSILKLYLNLGVDYTAKIKDVDNSQVFAWYVNPYITKSVGGGTFFAGFQLYSDGKELDSTGTKKDPTISWGVPIGSEVGF